MFQLLFERSADAIALLDPQELLLVDCNQAAVDLLRATNKAQLLRKHPSELSPPRQPDGSDSRTRAAELTALTEKKGTQTYEWTARRLDGTDVALEVMSTPIEADGRRLNVIVARDITERKKTEDALRASERKFRELFEASSDAITIIDPETRRFVDCNAATLRRRPDTTKEWLLARTVDDLSPERQPDGRDSRDAATEWIQRALHEGPQRLEWHGRRSDGSEIPLEMLVSPIRIGDRTLLVIVSRDITERKKTEQRILELNQDLERRIQERTAELSASEAQLRTLIEHAPEAIVVFDGETGRFISCNENATRLYGLSRAELCRLTPGEVSPEFQPDGRPSRTFAGERIREALAGGTPVFEWTHRRPDGVLVPCEVRLVRLPSDGPALIRASITDNTERKRTEQARRDSEEKFRALFEASSQGVILHDEHQMLEVNPACLRILGFQEAGEMIGKHPADTSAPLQPNGEPAAVLARRHIQECMTKGSTRFDWLARNSRGQEIPIEIVLTRIQWGGRQLIQAVFNDISERKRTEAELLRTLAREKELNQLKTNFVSMVSHEFRTPLGIIQSSAEILRDYLGQLPPAERNEQLRSIVKNTQRMAAMMDEILVLSRLDAGRMEFKPAPLDLAGFCRRVIDEVLSATDRRCPIELSLAELPAEARADERLLGHIFTNLLNNAVKYSTPGHTVHLAVERDGADAVCLVRDHGIGIGTDDQPWLFHAFQRGRNVGDRPGTGLGLVLVKRCADLHGGKVQIESALGIGTTVTVRLPVFAPDP